MLHIGLQTSQSMMPHLAMISPAWNHSHSSAVTKPPSRAALTGSCLRLAAWALRSSVTQSCPVFCDPMDCSTPGLPVHHQLPEFTQTHVHWVGDAIHPSHPLLSPSPLAFILSQHQGLFQWINSLHQVAKVLEFQLQHQSFQWIFRTDFL